MEASDQILPRHQVDACLAAYRRIHLCEQCGRNLNYRDAAHENSSQEARHISDDAAAEADHYARAVAARVHHLFRQFFNRSEALVLFTGFEKQRMERAA